MLPNNVIHYATHTPQIEFTQNLEESVPDSYISTIELKADLKAPSPSQLIVSFLNLNQITLSQYY